MRESCPLEDQTVKRTVRIDAFPEAAFRCLDRDAIVAVDVISATTALVTSAAAGRRTLVAANVKSAFELASGLGHALLAGEVGGFVPEGFEMPASPVGLASASATRPAVVLAPPGTKILVNASSAPRVYVACLRNASATVRALAALHPRVAIIGAGQGKDLRCEDQLATARLARGLLEQGYETKDPFTEDLVSRWALVDTSSSGRAQRRSSVAGRTQDLEFIVGHVDTSASPAIIDGEVCLEELTESAHAPGRRRSSVLGAGDYFTLADVAASVSSWDRRNQEAANDEPPADAQARARRLSPVPLRRRMLVLVPAVCLPPSRWLPAASRACTAPLS
jgi:phosphosulfolactate phosphohydrolase-like enzyme